MENLRLWSPWRDGIIDIFRSLCRHVSLDREIKFLYRHVYSMFILKCQVTGLGFYYLVLRTWELPSQPNILIGTLSEHLIPVQVPEIIAYRSTCSISVPLVEKIMLDKYFILI